MTVSKWRRGDLHLGFLPPSRISPNTGAALKLMGTCACTHTAERESKAPKRQRTRSHGKPVDVWEWTLLPQCHASCSITSRKEHFCSVHAMRSSRSMSLNLILHLFLAFYGEPFHTWEMWPSPHSEKPVGSEAGGQDPCPWTGSPMENQACIVPRLLWDLLLLKLPHPELRQQMFPEYIWLPKVCAKPPKYGVQPVQPLSPLSCNILLFEVISSILSFVARKR